jgi:hypothetical protein
MKLLTAKECAVSARNALAALWDWNKPPESAPLPKGMATNLDGMLARGKAAQHAQVWGVMRKGALTAVCLVVVLTASTRVHAPGIVLTPELRADEAMRHSIRVSRSMELPPSKTEQTGRSLDDINRSVHEFDLRMVPQ